MSKVHCLKIVAGGILGFAGAGMAAEKMEINPLWKSAEFRRAFTGSYGIDSRIEPKVSTEEKAVLDAVGDEMADGDRDSAMAELVGSPLLDRSPALIFTLANLRFEEGEVDDAVEGFEKALRLYPNFRDAHRNLAVAEVQRGDFDRAEPHLRRALELGSQDGLTLGLLGYCHSGAGRNQASLQAYRLAQLTMPEEAQWKIGEAGALLALNELEAAGSIYEAVLELRPDDVGLWVNLADVRIRLGEGEAAIADMEVARRLGGLGGDGVISLGHLYLNESLVDEAVGCYRDAISGDDVADFVAAVEAAEGLARFRYWLETKEIVEAIRDGVAYVPIFQGAAEVSSGEGRDRLERVSALMELEIGDPTIGAEAVESLLKKNAMDGEALLLMAKFKKRGGEGEKAEMYFEQATRVEGFEAEAQRELGVLLVERGDYKGALKPLRRAFELEPDAGWVEYLEVVEGMAGESQK